MFLKQIWFVLGIAFILPLDKVYKLNFINKNNQNGVISVCLGSPLVCYPFKVSTELGVSLVLNGLYYREGFRWKNSSSFKMIQKDTSLMYHSQKLIGSYVNDHFRLDSTLLTLYDLVFFMIDDGIIEEGIVGIIGLGSINHISSTSFLQLSNQFNHIANHAMHLSQKSLKGGFIQFGLELKTVEEYLNPIHQVKKIKTCSFYNNSEEIINCQLNSVIYYNEGNKINPIVVQGKMPVFFSNDLEGVICPYSFFQLLKENIFKNHLDNGKCSLITKHNIDRIICNESLETDIKGNLMFIIGKWNIKYSLLKLFNQRKHILRFLVMNTDPEKDYWILGNALFTNYDMIVDHDHTLIYFK